MLSNISRLHVIDNAPTTRPDATCADLYQQFQDAPDIITVAVLDGEEPVGLVNRHELMERMSGPDGWSRHADAPVHVAMQHDPLMVDLATPAEALTALVLRNRNSALTEGFIIVENGRYCGIGSALMVVRSIMADLKRKRREADEENRAKSEFLAVMSHELRTPLNAIIGFSETISLKALGDTEAAQKQYDGYIDDILGSGRFLRDLIERLLNLSRVESGHYDLDFEEIDLAKEARAVGRLLNHSADRKYVTLEVETEGVCTVFADAQALRQIIVNIVGNAIKFTPAGGVIRLSAQARGDAAIIRVTDNGPGFAETAQPVNPQIATAKGAGMGLKLSKGLAHMQGGTLTMRDMEVGGAEVTLRLPLLFGAEDNGATDKRYRA